MGSAEPAPGPGTLCLISLSLSLLLPWRAEQCWNSVGTGEQGRPWALFLQRTLRTVERPVGLGSKNLLWTEGTLNMPPSAGLSEGDFFSMFGFLLDWPKSSFFFFPRDGPSSA